MTTTRSGPRRMLATLAVAAVAFTATTLGMSPAIAADALRLDTGHIDLFNLGLKGDNSIELNLKEDVTGSHVVHAAEDVELFVKREAYVDVPASAMAYLPPGSPNQIWHLPITQDPNLVWPGWDSQGAASYYGSDADVDFVISAVDGPGDVYLWSSGVFGDPTQILASGWKLPGSIHQSFLAHTHTNWAFTAAGTYKLTATATITSQNGTKTSTSNAATYTFVVQPLQADPDPDPDPEPDPDTTVAIEGLAEHYHTGAVAALSAVTDPAAEDGHFHWFTRPSEADEWTVVEDVHGATYGFVILGAEQVKVALYDDDHQVAAESEPVTLVIDDHGSNPGVGPELQVALPEDQGALVISVAEEGKKSTLSDLVLNEAADRYVSTGSIKGITVTDTRPSQDGWTASGRLRGLITSDGSILNGSYAGWTPTVISSSDGQTVDAGPAVAPGFPTGSGIAGWQALGTSPSGSSRGTAVVGAGLRIEVPTSTEVGTYRGVVLITVA